jgi:hypothetical protein
MSFHFRPFELAAAATAEAGEVTFGTDTAANIRALDEAGEGGEDGRRGQRGAADVPTEASWPRSSLAPKRSSQASRSATLHLLGQLLDSLLLLGRL